MEINSKQAIEILSKAGSCSDITVLNAFDKNSVMNIKGHDVLELCLTAIEQDLKTLDIMKQYVRLENGSLCFIGTESIKLGIDDNDSALLKDKLTAKAPNCIISMVSLGEMRGDCTCSYDIGLKPNTTLKELIEYVLTNLNEWGYFLVSDTTDTHKYSIRYDRSQIMGDNALLPLYDRKIKKVTSDGGYSRMDYFITLE